jgi:Predicted aminopeptidase
MRARSLLAAAALAGLCLLLSSCYETEQGFRYLAIRSKARSLEAALADPHTSEGEKLLIQRAEASRDFALSELGLKRTRNYGSIVEVEGGSLATVVQACASLSFDRYLWNYPMVGRLPYRGYFDPKEAQAEAASLKAKGLDVIARPVDAFSTLGYLSDPLFSFMASYDEAEVAELVIHEMTHATIFLKGKGGSGSADLSQFNEELATFVGREGSLLYLSQKYGPDSREVGKARDDRADAEAFSAFLAGTAKELEALYSSKSSDSQKREGKAQIIAARAALYKESYATLFKGAAYEAFDMTRINNAYLDLYRLYEGESSLYRDFCQKACGGDLKRFIETLSRITRDPKTRDDPKAEMRRLLGEAGAEGSAPAGASR